MQARSHANGALFALGLTTTIAVLLTSAVVPASAQTAGGAGGVGFAGYGGPGGSGGSGASGADGGSAVQDQSGAGGGGGGSAGGGNGGAGGGGYMAAGGAGGAGGTALSRNGADGSPVVQGSPYGGAGGGGGGGGYNGNGAGSLFIGNTATLAGGSGGNGGVGGNGGNEGGGGGGGGAGGYGAVVTGTGTSTNSGTIAGGKGGDGGAGANGYFGGGNGGNGGAGGIGVYFTAPGATFWNSGTVSGGNGGAGGAAGPLPGYGNNIPSPGANGAGGAGVYGAGLNIANAGTISGGLNGDGVTRAYAIVFTGGVNSLANSGTIIGGIDVQSGSFAPAPPGYAVGTTLSFGGPIVFGSGAQYVIRLSPGTSDSLTASGSATLTGAVVDAQFNPGSYVAKRYTILTATGGLGGTTFAGLTNVDLPTGTSDSLSYDANNVYLNLTPGFASYSGLTDNQRNAANTLTNFFNATGGIPAQFFSLTQAGLTQISGEAATGAHTSVVQLTNDFLNLLLDPAAGGGGGAGGRGLSGFAPEQDASLPSDVALAYAKALKQASATAAPAPQNFDQRWTAWGSGFGGTSRTDGNAVVGSSDVKANDYGLAAGMDYRVTPDTVVGFALAGGGTNWNLAQGLGSGRSDSFQAGVYAKTHAGPVYLSAALGFANHWFTTDRTVLGDQLTASFMGQSYAARLEAGYRYAVPVPGVIIGVTPYVALQAQDFHTPGYSEIDFGGSGFGLSYNAQNATDTRSELGARFDNLQMVQINGTGMPLVLRGRLAWAHDWVSNPALGAAFEALPGTRFIVNGATTPKDSALTTVAAELHLAANWTAIAKFDGAFAAGSQTYGGTGTLKYSW